MTFSLANKMNVINKCQEYLYSQTNHEILCKKEKSLTRRERKEQNYKLHRAINSLKARSFKVTATAICKDSNLLQWKNLRTRFRIGSFVIFDASVTTYFALSWVYLGSCFVLTFAVLLQLLWSTTQFVFLSLGWTKHRIHQKGDFFFKKNKCLAESSRSSKRASTDRWHQEARNITNSAEACVVCLVVVAILTKAYTLHSLIFFGRIHGIASKQTSQMILQSSPK